jgi:hypothetical protein
MWDEMKKDYLEDNPDANIYNGKKSTLKMPPEDFILPIPKPKSD